MLKEKFSLKDHLFNAEKVSYLAQALADVYVLFDKPLFEQAILEAFPRLELKERIAHIRQCLRKFLPPDYKLAVAVILKSLPAPLDENLTDDDFGDFIYAPYNDFVAHFGCDADNLAFSLAALKEITKRFSAEDAIRFFINAFPQQTLQTLLEWSEDSNYHVRRLCSEGTRPKLPWSQKINITPETALPILNQLFSDKTRYVTRSVANHLNDIAKTDPDLVVKTLGNWQKLKKQTENEMNFIIKHALRTLVKVGRADALALMGYGDSAHIRVENIQHDKTVKIGSALNFSFSLYAQTEKSLIVDYIVHFQNKQGKMSNKKVFKLRSFERLASHSMMPINKRHTFKADMTTRQLYAGTHKIEIQVNGNVLIGFEFELLL
ncbi:MAG: DNA alkylation repair protein [Saprospiraceae bacterium]|nr:DNA alkylation repair protein [Saprospiraceae bacterium]